MSTYLHIQVPAQTAIPRGAVLVGRLIETFQAYAKARKAERKLRERAHDARRVRELANRLQSSDPGMASDLRCMLDRDC
ncbi:hypothetical protein [Ideonella sp. BN130291]|uniref:hypothetical protein n=1 Tax=Ideonella sp. BN130291 TaxID=3112940 RepID=UPI002E268224|nr:hypothetical protein [Ideonella sp. BN130291]